MTNSQPDPPVQLRLGMWGPPASGKTTFLAALKIATLLSRRPGNWIMNGTDGPSSRFLQQMTDLLADQRVFPTATDAANGMTFRFTGERSVPGSPRFPGGLGRRQPMTAREAFELDVLDVPGGTHAPDHTGADEEPDLEFADTDPIEFDEMSDRTQMLDHLQACQGIVYLFDPGRDVRLGDAFKYFQGTLEELSSRIFQPGYHGTRLPHCVAVCITKFDQPYVYQEAFRRGYSVRDTAPPYFPMVEDGRAGEFFHELCKDDHTNTNLVAKALERYFYEDRVKYFVTSSIGFYSVNGRFQARDPHNVEQVGDGDFRIRGKVHPLNVIEPLIWLFDNLKAKR
ncbi:hypothetical protein ACWDSJ_36970 [Nocardia sp. NPDC003482]